MIPIPILTYHSVDRSGSVISVHPEAFAHQMACLAEMGYRGVSLSEALTRREDGGGWPDGTVVLSFDDGYENLHRLARAVLARHGFTATAFLVTGHVGGTNDWETPPSRLGRQPMLVWAQVAELVQAGWEIGGHTRTHPDLRRLTAEQVAREILDSRQDIESRLGRSVETFAYPYGLTSDVATSVVAREFRAGCTTVLRRAAEEALHSLPRVDMYYVRGPNRLRQLLTGRLDPYLALRRWVRRLRS